jgi:hypothetical protein
LFWRVDCIGTATNEREGEDKDVACEVDVVYSFDPCGGKNPDNSVLDDRGGKGGSTTTQARLDFVQTTRISLGLGKDDVNHKPMDTLQLRMPPYGICGSKVMFEVTLQQPRSGQEENVHSIVECTAALSDWMMTGKSARRIIPFVKGGPKMACFELMPLRVGHLKVPLFEQRGVVVDAVPTGKQGAMISACSRNSSIPIASSGYFSTTATAVFE